MCATTLSLGSALQCSQLILHGERSVAAPPTRTCVCMNWRGDTHHTHSCMHVCMARVHIMLM